MNSPPVHIPQFSTSISRTIYCQNSGLPLANLDITIFEGHMAYMESIEDAIWLHPFYRLSSMVLIKKLEDSLHNAQQNGWIVEPANQTRMRLLTSAIMVSLDALKQDRPTLPSFSIAAGSAGRLLGLAKWYHFISSQRLTFPLYSVSKRNENLEWQNFKHWVDSAYEVRHDWATKSRELKKEAQQRAYEQSLKEIKSEAILKRVDTRKVWNWIHIQLADHYAKGRLETFQNLFLNGDLEAYQWNSDDIDDIVEALEKHCDVGNDIMFFIKKRLSGIRALIQDFRESFTVISSGNGESFGSEEQTPQEKALIDQFDAKVANLSEMPTKPKRTDFATLGLFMKAEATWNIMNKRFLAKQKQEKDNSPGAVQ